MQIANNRGAATISESCVKHLVATSLIDEPNSKDYQNLNTHIEDACVVYPPVGSATQYASIALIASFGVKFPILSESAKAALKSFDEQRIGGLVTKNAISRLDDSNK